MGLIARLTGREVALKYIAHGAAETPGHHRPRKVGPADEIRIGGMAFGIFQKIRQAMADKMRCHCLGSGLSALADLRQGVI